MFRNSLNSCKPVSGPFYLEAPSTMAMTSELLIMNVGDGSFMLSVLSKRKHFYLDGRSKCLILRLFALTLAMCLRFAFGKYESHEAEKTHIG